MNGFAHRTLLASCTALALLASSAVARAEGTTTLSMWNGANPYQCVMQDAGTATNAPDTTADPYCVEFDKTGESLLPNLGILSILMQEPSRIATALDKCFYYQIDHWTGAIIQGAPATQLWNWNGHYYLNFATGSAGAYFTNFTLGPVGIFPSLTFGFQITTPALVKPQCVTLAATLGSTSIYNG